MGNSPSQSKADRVKNKVEKSDINRASLTWLMGRTLIGFLAIELVLRDMAGGSTTEKPKGNVAKMTFGQLVTHIKASSVLPPDLVAELQPLVQVRNEFVHHFADRFALVLISDYGVSMVSDYLSCAIKLCASAYSHIRKVQDKRLGKRRLTKRALAAQIKQIKPLADKHCAAYFRKCPTAHL